ncbi:MAG: GIY-YIG nuclease family protein [Fretibacterium sp.]|nr:GIY-YIG nuclease family protein [Fretibacterium sp.]
MLRCRDGSLYSGWTNDLKKRLKAHNEGCASRYTRSRLPAELVYFEALPTREAAMRRECALKRLTRSAKLALIEGWEPDAAESLR